ncbi:restriction endonuclease fold toxin 5 domain-containing protein [Corallococcus sp. BB11-1]|uniref:restriction endonuclease fold toxin 5 domain-containing protein n=1 Tax=Corallococcus sp. BB11-1 TaxID=2996783 RepID=UPI00226E804E|nr:restriction endonuclease fold toxin 5 domain-containing protein [Corallococcus sp. BB11-1]MCY1029885.1 restriction endonuclease fold toxin 5 domain-containing protein [Corallococcus sp. BB11-1]
MSERARAYQEQVTGAPRGTAYRLRSGDSQADFDGFDPKEELLLEAKGPGYEKFIKDDMEMKDFFRGFGQMLNQARRQSTLAEGMRIRWYVAEKRVADLLRVAFSGQGIKVDVVHVPPVRGGALNP